MRPVLAAMLSVSGYDLTNFEKKMLEKSNPVGVTLFRRNIQNKKQVKSLIKSIKEAVGRENVLIAVDQEGGRVCRFSEPEWPTYLSQYALGSLKIKESKEITALHGSLIAADLHDLGVNWNYAPVMDVAYPDTTVALINRIFSSDEKKVSQLGKVLIDVYQKSGICPCIKHLPGHGHARVDPHLNLPILSQNLQELEKDFYPFRMVGESAPAGMTAHIVISAVDDKPVTQSKKAIQAIIRGEIGFKGFLISDAIDMKALGGTLAERACTSIEAGCDAVCYCLGVEDELKEVIKAVPPLTDEAMERLSKIHKIIGGKVSSFDREKAYMRYQELAKKTKVLETDYDAVEILNKMKEKI